MSKREAVVVLADEEAREASIDHMLTELQADLRRSPKGSLDARITAAMIEVLPPFVRTLDGERRLYWDGIKANGYDKDALDEHLQVLIVPMVNMISSVLMTFAPTEARVPGPECLRVRNVLAQHIFDNMFRGVSFALEGGEHHGRGH